MEFYELIKKLTQSICAGNSRAVADCFCDDGIYDDDHRRGIIQPPSPPLAG